MSPSKTTEIDGFQTIWRSKSDHPGIQALKTAAMSPRPLSTPVNAAVQLVKPKSVIASHANEEATKDGKVIAGTRTETFINAANMPVHVPLSGMTMSFDANGKCVDGC